MRGQQARGKVYARRLGGDIDLGLEPRRIKEFRDGIYQQELARIITPGGLLPGGVFQDIWSLSDTQNFRLGTRMAMDTRVFRYAKIGDCSKGDDVFWVKGEGRSPEHGIGMQTTCQTITRTGAQMVSGAVTSYVVVATLTAGQACAQDHYAGGYFGLHPNIWGCRILGNDISGGAPNYNTTFYLEGPLPYLVTGAGTVSFTNNPYDGVIRHGGAAAPVFAGTLGVFVPYVEPDQVAVDYEDWYTWLQTWGPFPEPQIGDEHEGGGDNEEQLWFQNGPMQCYPTHEAQARQIAGFYVPERDAENLRHPVVWLMITP